MGADNVIALIVSLLVTAYLVAALVFPGEILMLAELLTRSHQNRGS